MSHVLIPKHEKLSEEEVKQLFKKYEIRFQDLPKISVKDKALTEIEASEGDIIRITRISQTAGPTFFYRGVISD